MPDILGGALGTSNSTLLGNVNWGGNTITIPAHYSGLQYVQNPPTTLTYSHLSMYSGNRYLIVCNGQVTELPANATVEQAQDKAEELAHKHQSEAFILKPIRKVAPKRDVTTTDL